MNQIRQSRIKQPTSIYQQQNQPQNKSLVMKEQLELAKQTSSTNAKKKERGRADKQQQEENLFNQHPSHSFTQAASQS